MVEVETFKQRRDRVLSRLIEQGVLKTPSVINSLRLVRRELFVPEDLKDHAYVDTPLPIGYDQTISAIHMVGMMCEELHLEPGHKVLEVGAGSGYHAAATAELVAPSSSDPKLWGHVFTVEIVPQLARTARANLARAGYADRVTVINADGSEGYPDQAPYDRILVTAAAPLIPPPLIEQLKVGGIIVIPVGEAHFFQTLISARKLADGKLQTKSLCSVAFVPLRGKWGFKQ